MPRRRTQRGDRTASVLLWCWLCALACAGLCGLVPSPATAAAGEGRPNIIVINTDDQPASMFTPRVMPETHRILARGGTRFRRSIVATPLCCPARSAFLTGQYGHNNGVLHNLPGYEDLRDKNNVLPAWMGKAGYRTIHIGKYLNGYVDVVDDPAAAAPGWQVWHSLIAPDNYYRYSMSHNGREVSYGTKRRDYATSVLNKFSKKMVRKFAGSRRPIFMVVDQFAPHAWGRGPISKTEHCGLDPISVEPAARDRNLFADEPLPRPPSFNESAVADKPTFIQERALLSTPEVEAQERLYRCMLASLAAVDRGVAGIWKQLGRVGQRKNTAIVFTSDNGLYFGEHRITEEKEIPYRESVEVPLAIRLPAGSGRRASKVGSLVSNIDLAATILDLAGGEPCVRNRCRTLDGRSLVPLAKGREPGWAAERAVAIEHFVASHKARAGVSCAYQGLWQGDETYIEHSEYSNSRNRCVGTTDTELYDLLADPFQLQNRSGLPGTAIREAALAAHTDRLATCTGIRGRDPKPSAGRSYCE